jgi:hypothetical protein
LPFALDMSPVALVASTLLLVPCRSRFFFSLRVWL